jgi:hypothetical protein
MTLSCRRTPSASGAPTLEVSKGTKRSPSNRKKR